MPSLAPIVLFTYNRPEHTRITLEYLQRNLLADRSTLYIFCDGPKENASDSVLKRIAKVKKIIRAQKWTQDVHIIDSEKNKGLATNVIEGVTKIVNEHGRAIVLEDDLRIGKWFLTYMNEALDRYEDNEKVKQISGFLFPIGIEARNEAMFLPITNTIGWGTWKAAWNEIDLEAKGAERLKTDSAFRKAFNLGGIYNYTKMLFDQIERDDNGSWAIFYWWSVFTKGGITLFPDYPLIQHNDFDASGTHPSDYDHFDYPNWQDDYKIETFPETIAANESVFVKHKSYIKKNNRITLKNIMIKVRKKFKKR